MLLDDGRHHRATADITQTRERKQISVMASITEEHMPSSERRLFDDGDAIIGARHVSVMETTLR
jgi:hypothetical protein